MVQGHTSTSGAYLSSGAVVANRYKIIRTLGAGGMASVYLAEDMVLGETTVALKILKHSGSIADGTAERFLREVRLTHRINHENVVRTFDFGQEGTMRFYTMEYLSGKTLTSLMEDQVLPISTILRIALQICRGIAAIHSVGVIHRDLKPDNIMVIDSMRVKITDFGVARGDVSMLTGGAEQILGTIAYLAPETLIGEKVTPAVDYYAFGAILYELLTGHLPIEDNVPARLIMRKVEERPPDPRTYREDIPSWLAEAVIGLLTPNPQQRMRSVKSFVQSLASHAPTDEALDVVTATVGVSISELPTTAFQKLPFIGALSHLRVRAPSLRELVVATALACVIAFISPLAPGRFADRVNIDGLFIARGPRTPANELAVVAIDEQSYLNLNIPMATAWPRNFHVRLIDKLLSAGAKRVVFDILFVNDSGDPTADAAFAEALGKMPSILGASVGFSQQATLNGSFFLEQVIRPAPMFEERAAGLGVVGLPQDSGRIMRFLTERSAIFPEGRPLAEMALGDVATPARPGPRDLINFYGPVPTVPRFSYHDVIADERRIPPEAFKDKIVFVGLTLQSRTGPSQREAFTTPYNEGMFGTEIHATAASNLIKQDWIRRLSQAQDCVVAFILAVLAACMVAAIGGFTGLLVPFVFVTGAGLCQLYLFSSGIYVPVLAPIILGFLAGLIMRLLIAPSAGLGQRRWYSN
jgi:CHASE2 domain-containing sensor protein